MKKKRVVKKKMWGVIPKSNPTFTPILKLYDRKITATEMVVESHLNDLIFGENNWQLISATVTYEIPKGRNAAG